MTVIVTDHHEVPFEEWGGKKQYLLPPADAVVDPKRPDCEYPFHIYAERQWHINSWKLFGNLWGGTPKIWMILLKMLLLLR